MFVSAKGARVLGIADRNDLPLSVSMRVGNVRDVTLVPAEFDFYMIEEKPEKLIGDKALGQRSVRY